MDMSDGSEKIPSDTTGDRSRDLPTSSAALKCYLKVLILFFQQSIKFVRVLTDVVTNQEMMRLDLGFLKPMVVEALGVS